MNGMANIPAPIVPVHDRPTGFSSVTQIENNKWIIRNHTANQSNSKDFIMNSYFMDMTYDAPSLDHGFSYNKNKDLVMQPN